MYKTEEMKDKLRNLYRADYSKLAFEAVESILDAAVQNQEEDIYELIHWELDNYFIYYNDAWEYMKNWGPTDLSHAVMEGFHTISQIAYFHLQEEVFNILNEIGFNY